MKSALLVTIAVLAAPAMAQTSLPGAITSFGIEDFDRRAVDDSGGLWPFIPNGNTRLSPGLGSATEITLRGLGGDEAPAGRTAAVGTVVDGVPLPGVNGNRFGFFDLDRVEILRGPQGVTGGRGFLGGTTQVNLARPGQRVAGYVESGYGANKRWTLRGSMDLPLDPALGLKISAYRSDGRGYVRNPVTGERLNDSDNAGLRIAAELRPVDGVQWNVAAAMMRADGENIWNRECDSGECDGRIARTGMVNDRRAGSETQYLGVAIAGDKAQQYIRNRTETVLLTSNLQWSGAAHAIEFITGYARLTERYGLDFADGRPLPTPADPVPAARDWANGGATLLADQKRRQFTQEVRLSGTIFDGLRYQLGGFLLDARDLRDTADLHMRNIGAGQPVVLADRMLRVEEDVKAGYGVLTGNWGALTVNAGLRYSVEKQQLQATDQRPGCVSGEIGDCFASGLLAVPEISTKRWTPHASVEWRAMDALLLYGSATRGYRAGGWNLRALRPDGLTTYGAESGWTYEAGLRSRWLEDRVRLGVTGFITRIDDAQASWSQVDPAQRILLAEIDTVGDFRNKGVEAELSVSPLSNLDLSATLGWQDAEYRPDAQGLSQQSLCHAQIASACGRGIVTAAGEIATPAYAPKWTFSAGGSWDIHWKSGESYVTPAVWASYQSATELDAANNLRAPGRWLMNASLTLATDDGIWSASVECANCLDSDAITAGYGGLAYSMAPRTWLVKARRRF